MEIPNQSAPYPQKVACQPNKRDGGFDTMDIRRHQKKMPKELGHVTPVEKHIPAVNFNRVEKRLFTLEVTFFAGPIFLDNIAI